MQSVPSGTRKHQCARLVNKSRRTAGPSQLPVLQSSSFCPQKIHEPTFKKKKPSTKLCAWCPPPREEEEEEEEDYFPTHTRRGSSLHGEDFPRTLMRGSPDGMIEPASHRQEEEEEDLFVFNDTIEGPRAPAVKPGRVTQA